MREQHTHTQKTAGVCRWSCVCHWGHGCACLPNQAFQKRERLVAATEIVAARTRPGLCGRGFVVCNTGRTPNATVVSVFCHLHRFYEALASYFQASRFRTCKVEGKPSGFERRNFSAFVHSPAAAIGGRCDAYMRRTSTPSTGWTPGVWVCGMRKYGVVYGCQHGCQRRTYSAMPSAL